MLARGANAVQADAERLAIDTLALSSITFVTAGDCNDGLKYLRHQSVVLTLDDDPHRSEIFWKCDIDAQ
jgi:hypothetical protein